MTNFLINYAHRRFYKAQQFNIRTGLAVGGFDKAIALGRRDLDADFYERNRAILDEPQGAGLWLWKPYLILKAMREAMTDGDVLFYCDSGCHFIRAAAPVIDLCRALPDDKSILPFELTAEHRNRMYTKRDCFFYMGLDEPPYPDMTQVLGTFLVCRKTPFAIAFLGEWLAYAQDPRLLTDMPNQCGLPNYPDFKAHRHDQSILSLLARKHGLAPVADISQWGNAYRSPDLPQIILHTRWNE